MKNYTIGGSGYIWKHGVQFFAETEVMSSSTKTVLTGNVGDIISKYGMYYKIEVVKYRVDKHGTNIDGYILKNIKSTPIFPSDPIHVSNLDGYSKTNINIINANKITRSNYVDYLYIPASGLYVVSSDLVVTECKDYIVLESNNESISFAF